MMTLFRGLKKTSVVAALVTSLTAAIPGVAGATPILQLSVSGAPLTTVTTPGGGIAGFNNGYLPFGDLTSVSVAGYSKPISGTAAHPLMHLNSVDLASKGGATVDLLFNDNNFNGINSIATLNSWVGGGSAAGSATVQFSTYVDMGNSLLGTSGYTPGTLVATSGPLSLSPGNFSTDLPGTFGPTTGPYAITMKAHMVLSPNAQISWDHFTTVPDPGTVLLLGAGMLGLAGANRRKRRKNQSVDQD
jgi:hypothetical protein